MKRQAKELTLLQKISTFEESLVAAKIVSRAIEDGLLDDAGEVAEITPEDFVVDLHGKILGVVATIRASAPMVEGVFKSGRFVREVTSPESNVRPLRSMVRGAKRRSSGMIETKLTIPAA